MKTILEFIKKDVVLCIAAIIAIISCFIVLPNAGYLQYIDFRTLSLLFSLIAVMAGLQKCGIFTYTAHIILSKAKNMRQVSAILVMLCFFLGMAITNDVALIIFVPFAITVLQEAKEEKMVLITLVMQTLAANLGSMLTPMGNPQNLYLCSISGMNALDVVKIMFPYTLAAFILICIWIFTVKAKKTQTVYDTSKDTIDKRKILLYLLLFIVCMFTVAGKLSHWISLAAVVVVMLIFDRKTFIKTDYSLIITFICFFVFIGNMKHIPSINKWLENVVQGHEFIASVLSSQIISNVPAAVLLSGFSCRYDLIMIGADIGGLGTIIASMASLISYKYFSVFNNEAKGKYMAVFTIFNILYLVVMVTLFAVLNGVIIN